MSCRTYSPGVLIGNWNEDVYLEQDSLKDFIYKKERGELLIQRSKQFKDRMYRKDPLSISKDGFIHFGDTVMLVNPENLKVDDPHSTCASLSLAVTPNEIYVHKNDALPSPCRVTACIVMDPVARNTFRILSTEGEAMGEPLRYGQNFGLGATGGFPDRMLYLASDHKHFQNAAKKSAEQEVILTDELSYLSNWQALYLDPQMRLEYEGFPVSANSRIIIIHSYTNQGLAVPRNFWMRTYFGKEYEVNCHTYLDTHRAEEGKNYWIMVTGSANDATITMLNRPKPPTGITRQENPDLQEET